MFRLPMAFLRQRYVPIHVEDCIAYYSDGDAAHPGRRTERSRRRMAGLRDYRPIGSCDLPPNGYPYGIVETVRFRKDVGRIRGRQADLALLENAIGMLAMGADLRSVYHSERFGGHTSSWREYRMESGLSLIYRVEGSKVILLAVVSRPMQARSTPIARSRASAPDRTPG